MAKHNTKKPFIYHFALYQIDPDISDEARTYLYASTQDLRRQRKTIDPSFYRKVYEGEVTAECGPIPALDLLWLKFNTTSIFKDFTGRSMSVSDIIVLTRNQNSTTYFCDTIGFQRLAIRMEA